MAQNRSNAVMASRIEPNDSLDDFPTQPWGTRAVMVHIIKPLGLPMNSVLEPACNRGYMVRPLMEYFGTVISSDVHQYGDNAVRDFLFPGNPERAEWVFTNPPFRLAEQFIAKAAEVASIGYGMLVRTAFLESSGRYERLFKPNPPTIVAQYVERLPMVKGRVDPKASTATSYCWVIWIKGMAPQPFRWIPPCRAQLERASDYPSAGSE